LRQATIARRAITIATSTHATLESPWSPWIFSLAVSRCAASVHSRGTARGIAIPLVIPLGSPLMLQGFTSLQVHQGDQGYRSRCQLPLAECSIPSEGAARCDRGSPYQ